MQIEKRLDKLKKSKAKDSQSKVKVTVFKCYYYPSLALDFVGYNTPVDYENFVCRKRQKRLHWKKLA